ncbi:hypothetical protein [Raoultella ornithinolytica]|jgi:hypothetical protein|uniref:hypothetical protein n=1 Tax=Raoultella ornithinolytica TaxID=54291 RepID=UPI001D0FD5CA|nr:hypothetical protein [Raoultella ornithinolytica]
MTSKVTRDIIQSEIADFFAGVVEIHTELGGPNTVEEAQNQLTDRVLACVPEVDSEPVAWRWRSGPNAWWQLASRGDIDGEVEPLYRHAQPAPVVPKDVMPGGLVYSSALPKFESNDSDKVVGYCCFISGETRIVEIQEQAYADAKAVLNAFRAAMQEVK